MGGVRNWLESMWATDVPVTNAETETVRVPRDYPSIIRAGTEYKELISVPGWKRLLDDMETRANAALAKVRANISTDPAICKSLVDRWREAEESLKFIQITAAEAIERRTQVLQDLGEQMGIGSGLDLDDAADVRSIEDFMYGQHKPINHDEEVDNE